MGLLDTLSGSIDGAFSLSRYLATAFEGSAVVRLREDNGSTEIDFKLNGSDALVTDDINEDTVSTWLTDNGASNAYIAKWYDQSGNGRNYSQATASNQPLLVESGIDSKATAEFFRVPNSHLLSDSSYQLVNTNGGFISAVSQVDANRPDEGGVFSDPNSSTLFFGFAASLGGWLFFADTGQEAVGGTTVLDTPDVVVWEFPTGGNPKACTIRDGGTEVANASLNVDSRSGTCLIGKHGTASTIDHSTAELLFTNEVLSSGDRDLVESSQGTQFGITIAGGAIDLVAQDATHSHTAENIDLTQTHILTIADAVHAHAADNLILSVATDLTIADSVHSHTVENITLTQDHQLLINDALHSLTSDNIDLTQNHILIVDDALHALISDNVTLGIPTGVMTPSERVYIVKAENRVYIVAADDRIHAILKEDRIYPIH